MATGRFEPCPHCDCALSYLEGVTGSTMTPKCPRCGKVVTVDRATFLMADNSRPHEPKRAGGAAGGSRTR
jgi:hypothetical protein